LVKVVKFKINYNLVYLQVLVLFHHSRDCRPVVLIIGRFSAFYSFYIIRLRPFYTAGLKKVRAFFYLRHPVSFASCR